MKKVTLLILTALLSFPALSQSDTTSKFDFEHHGVYTLNGMYSRFNNWQAGGNDNINATVQLREQVRFAGPKRTSRHNLQLDYGINRQGELERKTIDKLQYTVNVSKGGKDDTKLFRLSGQLQLNTQITDGFAAEDSLQLERISDFAAPLYAQLSFGLTSNRFRAFNLFFSPIGTKTTFVLDSAIRAVNNYGLVSADVGALVEGGANATLSYNKTFGKSLRVISRTDVFFNYEDFLAPEVDVRGEFMAIYRIDKWFSANINAQYIFDKDATEEAVAAAAALPEPIDLSHWQTKAMFGFGLTFTIH